MAVSGIGYGNSVLGQSVRSLNDQLTTLSAQLTTGRKATTYAGMGVNEGFAIAARAQLSNISAFTDTMTKINTTISVANLDGSDAHVLPISAGLVKGPHGVAIDPVSRKLYWTNYDTSAATSWIGDLVPEQLQEPDPGGDRWSLRLAADPCPLGRRELADDEPGLVGPDRRLVLDRVAGAVGIVERDPRVGLQLRRLVTVSGERVRQRHREARRVRGGDQLLRARLAALLLEARDPRDGLAAE